VSQINPGRPLDPPQTIWTQCHTSEGVSQINPGGPLVPPLTIWTRGRYTSERVHKQCGKNYAFLGHLGRIYLCQHTRNFFGKSLVMSTIATGKNCALQSSHKKISTSDKVI
jgi:hypothetical protein